MNNTLKVGLDIHGVIDAFPQRFKQLAYALIKDGAEAHIITGIKRDEHVERLLAEAGIRFTHYFSIVEYLKAQQEYIEWEMAKRDYCKDVGIAFMFDDSPTYLESFHDIDTSYVHVINREREIYVTR